MLFQRHSPEHINNPELHHAYYVYMAGFNGSDEFLLDDAVERLTELQAPYIIYVEDSTERLTGAIRTQAGALGGYRLDALADITVSYAYSGLEFEVPLLASSIALVGKKPKYYVGAVIPDKELLTQLEPRNEAEEKRLKQLGKYACKKLANYTHRSQREERRLLKRAKDLSVANFITGPDSSKAADSADQ